MLPVREDALNSPHLTQRTPSDGIVGDHFQTVVGIFEEVPGVESDLEPGRVDGIDHPLHAFRSDPQPPVVLRRLLVVK